MVPEAAAAEVDFAQAVEEEEPGPHGRVLELLLNELQREKARSAAPAAAGPRRWTGAGPGAPGGAAAGAALRG